MVMQLVCRSAHEVRWKMLVFIIWVSFEKFKSDWSKTWFKDAIVICLYVNEVKGHLRSSLVENVKFV